MSHHQHIGDAGSGQGPVWLVITGVNAIIMWLSWGKILGALPAIASGVTIAAGLMACRNYYYTHKWAKEKREEDLKNKKNSI